MINSIAFFAFQVTDMPRARAFYEGTLGLKLETNFSDVWVEYDIAGQTFAITNVDTTHQAGVKGGMLAFEVDDLDITLADLKAKQVALVMDVMDTPVCRMAVIADPDGNHITIHKRKG
jgi:predicted enzyme related to lactoylglutathione lyase